MRNKKSKRCTAPVRRWPGENSPWHFVTLNKKLFAEIREKCGKGMIRINTTIGKTNWDNVLFPHTRDKAYILAVKKMVREKENIFTGDEIRISFKMR